MKEIVAALLRLGATSYGGPAIMGIIILPALDRVRTLGWVKAVRKGMAPAVIGVLAVSLIRLAPAALPDLIALVMLGATIVALVVLRTDAFRGTRRVVREAPAPLRGARCDSPA
jgi:chromate transport protein ChrA